MKGSIGLGLFLALLSGSLASGVSEAELFAIVDARLFDGVQTHERATVVVAGSRIQAVHVGEAPELPGGTRRFAGAGHTVYPGLIDAHVHIIEESGLADSLAFGVTTVLDMAMPIPSHANALQAMRGRPEYAHQADYFSAVVSPTTPGGHGTEMGLEFPTLRYPEEADAFIADRVAEGSDFIKITLETGSPLRPFTWVPPSTLKALIDATHRHGLLAVAHITDPDIAKFAIESGMDGIVHIWGPRIGGGARPDVAAAARRKGAFFVPTLTVFEHSYDTGGAASLLGDAELAGRLSEAGRANLEHRYSEEHKRIRVLAHPSADPRQAFADLIAATRGLHDARVSLLVGADAPNYGTWYGISMHREMELLVQAGLTPVEALQAASAAAARSFRLYDRGHIAPGFLADLVLVEGNPTVDIRDSRRIRAVWKGGVLLD